jgi:chromosome segregation ATPase
MDIFFTLLQELAKALSPSQFVLVLCTIAAACWTIVYFIVKNLRNKSGIWAFLGANEEPVDLKDLKTAIDALSSENAAHHTARSAEINSILAALEREGKAADERTESLMTVLEELKEVHDYLDDVKADLTRQIDELKHQFTMHDLHEQQIYESHKITLNNTLDMINKVHNQVEKIDEYVRNAVPEFKQSHRDLTKDLSNLSRDVALIERSIQTQISSVNAVKLR